MGPIRLHKRLLGVICLVGRLFGDRPPHEVDTRVQIGSATRLFHADLPRELRALGRRTSFLLWRSGNTLAVVETFGPELGRDDRAAAELAPFQQAHIEKPTRYTAAERYDAEVPLDDPALKQPVYWLGRNFGAAGVPRFTSSRRKPSNPRRATKGPAGRPNSGTKARTRNTNIWSSRSGTRANGRSSRGRR